MSMFMGADEDWSQLPPLSELSKEEYYNLKEEGTLFVYYPEATGLYWLDLHKDEEW